MNLEELKVVDADVAADHRSGSWTVRTATSS